MQPDEIRQAVTDVGNWRHPIDLGHGIVTPGVLDCPVEMERLGFPARLDGARVLDVGCSDGFYSFEAERRGASEVLAIDDLSSMLNTDRRNGFEVARTALGSEVRFEHRDVVDLSPERDGRFDVVLLINVLYHLRHPLLALDRLAEITAPGGVLLLKTYYRQDVRVWIRGRPFGFDVFTRPRMEFFETTELGGDPTNWWAPNRPCLEGMLRSAGFGDVTHLTTAGDRTYYRATR